MNNHRCDFHLIDRSTTRTQCGVSSCGKYFVFRDIADTAEDKKGESHRFVCELKAPGARIPMNEEQDARFLAHVNDQKAPIPDGWRPIEKRVPGGAAVKKPD